jgi:hypothetical protein
MDTKAQRRMFLFPVSPIVLTWQTNFSFYIISTLVAWASFGMAIRIPLILNTNLEAHNRVTPTSDLAPLKARGGNATWLILTGAVRIFRGFSTCYRFGADDVDRSKDAEFYQAPNL